MGLFTVYYDSLMFSHIQLEANRVPAGFHSNALIMFHGNSGNNSYFLPFLTSWAASLFSPLCGSVLGETALRRGDVDAAAKLNVVPL